MMIKRTCFVCLHMLIDEDFRGVFTLCFRVVICASAMCVYEFINVKLCVYDCVYFCVCLVGVSWVPVCALFLFMLIRVSSLWVVYVCVDITTCMFAYNS